MLHFRILICRTAGLRPFGLRFEVRAGEGVLLIPGRTKRYVLARSGQEKALNLQELLQAQFVHRLNDRWRTYAVWNGDAAFLQSITGWEWFEAAVALCGERRIYPAPTHARPASEEAPASTMEPGQLEPATQVKAIMLIADDAPTLPELSKWERSDVLIGMPEVGEVA